MQFFRKNRETITDWLRRHFTPRILLLLAVSLLLFLAAGILYLIRIRTVSGLYDQQAAKTWSENGEGVSQISVFWPNGKQADAFAAKELEYKIKQELIKESITDGQPESGPVFVTCMSARGEVELTRDNTKVNAHAIGTYGDFFRFHPVTLLSGSLYPDDLLVPDHVLLDENLAWQLFGGYDIEGQIITIGGVSHTVAGVFRVEKSGQIEKKAGIPDNLCFLSLESLCQLGKVEGQTSANDNGKDAAAVGTAKIYGVNAWEIVMPDPVKNFAINLIKEQVRADKEEIRVVENSARFLPEALRKNLGGGYTRGMQVQPYVFPYWENIAIGYGNVLAILWLWQVILTVIAAGIPAILLIRSFRHRTWTLGGILKDLSDRKYDLESRMKYGKKKWENF